MSRAMLRMASVTAATKRSPGIVNGKRGEPVTNVASLHCTPLDPVDAETRQRLGLDSPHELLQTFVDGAEDVREGDYLVVGTTEYPVKSCAEWTWRGSRYLHLILEDLKR